LGLTIVRSFFGAFYLFEFLCPFDLARKRSVLLTCRFVAVHLGLFGKLALSGRSPFRFR
jgi:hypothetical protein